jgi:nicotinate-nucleotide adenylyltransferase
MADRVGLFGGTFDPIHVGHLMSARAVAERLGLDQLILIPSAKPPHKHAQVFAEATDRLEMVRLAIADEQSFELSDCEIRRAGPSYTIETVQHFRDRLGSEVELYWIIGADSLAELSIWRRIAELAELCQIVTACRPGFESPDLSPLTSLLSPQQIKRLEAGLLSTPLIDISATQIRRRVSERLSIRWLVPPAVARYIEQHGLYRG